MSDHAKHIAFSLLLIAIGIGSIVVINTSVAEQTITGTNFIRFSTMPTIYGALLVVLSGLYLLDSVRKVLRAGRDDRNVAGLAPPAQAANAAGPSPRTVAVRTFGALVMLVAYTVLLDQVHFFLLTTAFLAALFFLFGHRNLWRVAIVSIAGGTGLYALFIVVLDLPI